jgi:indole-3-glycerol phosphate synthase
MKDTARPDVLATIVAATRRIVELRSGREPHAALESRAMQRAPRGDRFRASVADRGRLNIIAECKRRSPSRGVLRAAYDPAAIARGYEQAGAAAISVLTEPTFFDGALEHLSSVRASVDVPLLRKDFVVDRYQLLEARAHGADAVLLIVAALSDAELRALLADVEALEMGALVEVHALDELDRALDAGAEIVGVNNRNLRTLDVDARLSELVAARIPADAIAVSESGLKTAADVARLGELGYRAFLIGERFMTAPDPGEALGELMNTMSASRQRTAPS